MKTGRKQKAWNTTFDGSTIDGLTRRPDGRWRIIGTQKTYTEHDERKAIQRFYKLQGIKKFEGTGLDEDEIKWLELADRNSQSLVDQNAVTAISRGFALVGDSEDAWRKFWAFVAHEIRTRSKHVAEQTGIEEIAYLSSLKPTLKPLAIKEIEKVWDATATCGRQEKKLVVVAWNDFVKKTGIVSIEGITAEKCIAYQSAVRESGVGGKMQSHKFGRVRRILRHLAKQAIAVDSVLKVMPYLQLLAPNGETTSLEPNPISREEFHKMLAASKYPADRAMLLLMLNAALYLQEVVRVKWSKIKNGCFVSHRAKKGKVVRVAVLWKETIDALAEMPKRTDEVFLSEVGTVLKSSGAEKRFRRLRTDAEIPEVTTSMLRDGAITAAGNAGVKVEIYRVLSGHRSGIDDHYIKRNPQAVKPATDAVYAHYFG